jgi:hypothetical protein
MIKPERRGLTADHCAAGTENLPRGEGLMSGMAGKTFPVGKVLAGS